LDIVLNKKEYSYCFIPRTIGKETTMWNNIYKELIRNPKKKIILVRPNNATEVLLNKNGTLNLKERGKLWK
jgi:hypothetical protein